MQTRFLIIGQGIAGTWLSYYLQQAGASFMVLDASNPLSSSRLAAGIINPVTGRRHVAAWMVEDLHPFAWKQYNQLGRELGIRAISEKSILDFFPSAQMRQSFMQRVEEKAQYVHGRTDEAAFREHFNYDFGFGEIKPAYTAHLEHILPAWRSHLIANDQLREEKFETDELILTGKGIRYRDIEAEKIIFCEGSAGAENRYFQTLPYAPNKGELLTVEIPDLPAHHIYKKGMILAPLAEPGKWWIGSNYSWKFDDDQPTPQFREQAETLLKSWLKVPFTVTGHFAGIRPATLERRPFVGLHPRLPQIGIFNGLGTKGCSLSPWFAKELAGFLLSDGFLSPEADITRFQKILTR